VEKIKSYFYGWVKRLLTTISGSLAKLGWAVCILKYQSHFCIAKTCDFSN